jgi:hypothetical protein
MRLNSRTLVILWLIGFAGSFLIQTVFRNQFADLTLWGRASGWQNEIAIWNIGLVLILGSLLKSRMDLNRIVPGLILLSTCFALNHLIAALQGNFLGNWAGFVTNLFVICLAMARIVKMRRL